MILFVWQDLTEQFEEEFKGVFVLTQVWVYPGFWICVKTDKGL